MLSNVFASYLRTPEYHATKDDSIVWKGIHGMSDVGLEELYYSIRRLGYYDVIVDIYENANWDRVMKRGTREGTMPSGDNTFYCPQMIDRLYVLGYKSQTIDIYIVEKRDNIFHSPYEECTKWVGDSRFRKIYEIDELFGEVTPDFESIEQLIIDLQNIISISVSVPNVPVLDYTVKFQTNTPYDLINSKLEAIGINNATIECLPVDGTTSDIPN